MLNSKGLESPGFFRPCSPAKDTTSAGRYRPRRVRRDERVQYRRDLRVVRWGRAARDEEHSSSSRNSRGLRSSSTARSCEHIPRRSPTCSLTASTTSCERRSVSAACRRRCFSGAPLRRKSFHPESACASESWAPRECVFRLASWPSPQPATQSPSSRFPFH